MCVSLRELAQTIIIFSIVDATLGSDCNTASDCLEENSRCLYNNYDSSPRTKCFCNYNAEYNQTTGQCDISMY